MSLEKYFSNYPDQIKDQIRNLIESGRLKDYLLAKYPHNHQINTDKQLYQYANALKDQYMKKVAQLNKVVYEKKSDLIKDVLGTHTFVSRNHGGKLKKKHEMRISSLLKNAPEEMLEMLVVHELAHFKEKDHNKAFYNLCVHMQPEYHQIEFDLRLYLLLLDQGEVLY